MTSPLISFNVVNAQRIAYERPPVDYLNTPVNDAVAQLAEKVAAGEVELRYDEDHGYLPAVLEALDVPIDSQTLVFSKTSLQIRRISPRRPRAIYFNDEVYVGWCQNGDVVELAATDPKQGAIFYTLAQSNETAPEFIRDRGQCLTCHASSRTQDVPGYLIRSVFANAAGRPAMGSRTYTTDHTSEFNERWGGWYVSGTHGEMRHMGNSLCSGSETSFDLEAGANTTDLSELFNTKPYLSEHSDLVALMVMEHQTQMHNAIAAANYESRLATYQSEEMNRLLEKDDAGLSESANRRIEAAAENVVYHLLMAEEFKLESPVSGTSGFQKSFPTRGIKDSKGRSLRDFDCQTRLFKYPCSFLIHSAAFQGLPDEVRTRILEKLVQRLTNEPEEPEFTHFTPDIRRDVLDILLETHTEFHSVYTATVRNGIEEP